MKGFLCLLCVFILVGAVERWKVSVKIYETKKIFRVDGLFDPGMIYYEVSFPEKYDNVTLMAFPQYGLPMVDNMDCHNAHQLSPWEMFFSMKTCSGRFYDERPMVKCYGEAEVVFPVKDKFAFVLASCGIEGLQHTRIDISNRKQSMVSSAAVAILSPLMTLLCVIAARYFSG